MISPLVGGHSECSIAVSTMVLFPSTRSIFRLAGSMLASSSVAGPNRKSVQPADAAGLAVRSYCSRVIIL